MATPFLKWVGGKQAQADALVAAFPPFPGRYFEPFLGGGSVALGRSGPAVVCDSNAWLVDTYRAVRDDWKGVAAALDALPNTAADYARIRGIDPEKLPPAVRAAHFIYLNKTGFRGLFRVNRAGRFNVPYGAYDRRTYAPENLAGAAAVCATWELRVGDFEVGLAGIAPGDFAYLDPPYYKLGGYSDFNRYTPGQFVEADHRRVAEVCRALDARGVTWMVSNSDTLFVHELFSGFRIQVLPARREINLTASRRDVSELRIANF